jgi:hypothetical protein
LAFVVGIVGLVVVSVEIALAEVSETLDLLVVETFVVFAFVADLVVERFGILVGVVEKLGMIGVVVESRMVGRWIVDVGQQEKPR